MTFDMLIGVMADARPPAASGTHGAHHQSAHCYLPGPQRYRRTPGVRRKASPLLVGPGDGLEQTLVVNTLLLQGPEHRQAGEQSQGFVMSAGQGLAVHVASNQPWGPGVLPLMTQEEGAQGIEMHQAAQGPALVDKPQASMIVLRIGRQLSNALGIEGPDGSQVLNIVPEAETIQHFTKCAICTMIPRQW